MWRVIWFFLGVSRLSITGASPEWCMQRLAKARIAFHFCAKPDDFTAEVWILRRDEARAAQLVRILFPQLFQQAGAGILRHAQCVEQAEEIAHVADLQHPRLAHLLQ